MSAPRWERDAVLAAREDWDQRAAARGHQLRWRLGPGATRRGQAYYWVGACRRCGAEIQVGSSWTSCGVPRDARAGICPGTRELSADEQRQASAVADAVATFTEAIRTDRRRGAARCATAITADSGLSAEGIR